MSTLTGMEVVKVGVSNSSCFFIFTFCKKYLLFYYSHLEKQLMRYGSEKETIELLSLLDFETLLIKKQDNKSLHHSKSTSDKKLCLSEHVHDVNWTQTHTEA